LGEGGLGLEEVLISVISDISSTEKEVIAYQNQTKIVVIDTWGA
jgi:hypothetical protein